MELQSKKAGLAEILEVTTVTPETTLDQSDNWDSMSVVMTVALLDDVAGAQVDGVALSECETVAEVLALAGIAE